jgi:hypothetical protein
MDPSKNYEEQMEDARKCLEECIYGDWEIYGDSNRISDKWLKSKVGKCFINHKFTLGKLILAGEPKPPEVLEQHWKDLVAKTNQPSWLEKSKSMATIAQKRGIRNSTRTRVEKAVSVRLVYY